MTKQPQVGASVRARGRIPSIDLSSLVACICQAFPSNTESAVAPSGQSVLSIDPKTGRLRVNTVGFLLRLYRSTSFKENFQHSDTSGFLRDFIPPPRGSNARTGGKVYNDDLGKVAQAVDKLRSLIVKELSELGIGANGLLVGEPEKAFEALSQMTGLSMDTLKQTANIQSVGFANNDRTAKERENDVARLISAGEEVQAEDWLERLANSIGEAQSRRDEEFDEIEHEKLIATLRDDAEKINSQVTRFLNFLEDQALSRIRLAVTFAIMEALAAQLDDAKDNHKAFRQYVKKVLTLFDLFGSAASNVALSVDLTRDYGMAADFSFSDELSKALFYSALPVWAEGNTQLFETRRIDPTSKGVSVSREVSYRFRVNGNNPEIGKASFDARLDRLSKQFNLGEASSDGDSNPSPFRLRRGISEIVFLWMVMNPNLDASDLQTSAEELAGSLKTEGKARLSLLVRDLQGWSPQVAKLGSTLVDLIRNKSRNVVTRAQMAVDDLYVVVQQSIVDWDAVERSGGKVRDPLVKASHPSPEDVEWFRHIKIAKRPDEVLRPLFSIRVSTELHERVITSKPDHTQTVHTLREIPKTLLNICWQPVDAKREENGAITLHYSDSLSPEWSMGTGIDILYDPNKLASGRNHRAQKTSEETRKQYRAAAISALSALVYTVLETVIAHCSAEYGSRIPTLMLRFQRTGKEESPSAGDPLIYSATQAIESTLMRDAPIRMQGMVTSAGNRRFKNRGTHHALLSAFPIIIEEPEKPAIEKVAVIVYATRPCDDHPGIADADGYIFGAKTYLAEVTEMPFCGYRMQFDRMQSHVVDSREAFESPMLIEEEVSRLHREGYCHVVLISDHFGNRRINRSAQRHSPHTQTAFLDEIANKLPDVNVYTLRRDVFPAVRLRKRHKNESAFEAIRLDDHNAFTSQGQDGMVKQLIPTYTFATLAVVGSDATVAGRPQSGFCTYFLDSNYQVRDVEWRERVRSNLLNSHSGIRQSILSVLRGLHFVESEKAPDNGAFKPVLDPFSWIRPSHKAAAGEIEIFNSSRRRGAISLSLPALLSRVSDALHRKGNS